MATKEKEPSERDSLEVEKIELAKKLGIWGKYEPSEGWRETAAYKRIKEIDLRLSEIING